MDRLRKRSDFLAVAKGRRVNRPGFTLQILRHEVPAPAVASVPMPAPVRIGFTMTRKLGGATVRNRIRRRLREAVRLSIATLDATALDIVVVGRIPALTLPFDSLLTDMAESLAQAARPARTAAADERRAGRRAPLESTDG